VGGYPLDWMDTRWTGWIPVGLSKAGLIISAVLRCNGNTVKRPIHSQLTPNLLTSTIVAPPSNASKWQMGFNSAFKGLNWAIYCVTSY
jgi:hypothetical protein